MQATVVAQVERQISEFIGKRCAMVVSVAIPLSVVHAEPVYEHQEFARGCNIALSLQSPHRIVQVNAFGAISQTHVDGQRVSGP